MINNVYMKKALKLAEKGAGFVSPNPMVGAVIVKKDEIISTGFHEKFGGSHAEVNAFDNLNKSAKGATLFVSLEPCCHHGKTPPCTDAIIKSGIKKVVIGMIDPHKFVGGKGIKILKKNGIKVEIENLGGKVEEFYEDYIKYCTTGMPFVTLKMAMTIDGKIASVTGDSKWITCEKSRLEVHKLRKKSDAILVGVGTVVKDNPHLTPYMLKGDNPAPDRIILDPSFRIPLKSNVIQDDGITTVVIDKQINATKADELNLQKVKLMKIPCKSKKGHNKFNLSFLLSELGEQEITSVLIEGGGNTAYQFLNQKLVDKIMFFIAPKILGGEKALTAVGGEGINNIIDAVNIKKITVKKIDSDVLITGYPEYK